MTKYFLFSLLLISIFTLSGKDLKLSNTFSDGIVFQRDKSINVWGTATPKKTITIRFGEETKSTKTDDEGPGRQH